MIRPLGGAPEYEHNPGRGKARFAEQQRESMAVDLATPILVVDDFGTMVRIMRHFLKQLGFRNVDDASDGAEALQKLQERRYGLVISDWNMEPMTGYELLEAVRGNEELAALPFIMVTAESKTDNVMAAKQAGASNYIVKPFNAATLAGKIEKVLGGRLGAEATISAH